MMCPMNGIVERTRGGSLALSFGRRSVMPRKRTTAIPTGNSGAREAISPIKSAISSKPIPDLLMLFRTGTHPHLPQLLYGLSQGASESVFFHRSAASVICTAAGFWHAGPLSIHTICGLLSHWIIEYPNSATIGNIADLCQFFLDSQLYRRGPQSWYSLCTPAAG